MVIYRTTTRRLATVNELDQPTDDVTHKTLAYAPAARSLPSDNVGVVFLRVCIFQGLKIGVPSGCLGETYNNND